MPFGSATITSDTVEDLFTADSDAQPIGVTNSPIVLEYGPFSFRTLDANKHVTGTASGSIDAAKPHVSVPLVLTAIVAAAPAGASPAADAAGIRAADPGT